jgi:alkaline phosphatase
MKSYFAELVSEGLPGLVIEPDLEKLVLETQATDLNYSYLPANTIGQMIARQTGFYWASSGHTNQPVVVAAMGPGSQLFQGYHDNTDFAKIVRTLMGVK